MLRKVVLVLIQTLTFFSLFRCQTDPERISIISTNTDIAHDGWGIPEAEIISGGVARDGIPSLFNPVKISADEADYLKDEDLIVGMLVGDQPVAYPHTILDWHEVVNEDHAGQSFILSYCPLTGSAIAFDGNIRDRRMKFGVSGLLFRNNLILFDRETESHWPQMRLQCEEGELRGTKLDIISTIETGWGAWKKLYPNTLILSTSTGFNRPYDQPGIAYPDYDLLHSRPAYQITIDERLPIKQRVHGILSGQGPEDFRSKVFPIKDNQPRQLIHDSIDGQALLIIDAGMENFVVSYYRTIDNTALNFKIADSLATFPFTIMDEETGSVWNVSGKAIEGPLKGTQLERPLSFYAYWFAWAAFYPNSEIYAP